ncbi:MAG: anhydro-N-acetylmuramic acid kinase [Bacteroidetes bacterium]|nr:MAG: anhydro-N-acetylmuramic acid kinase [Bacteroidota bacterium]
MKQSYKVIGLMSGTSLDGLDMAACEFITEGEGQWRHEISAAVTVEYPERIRKMLSGVHLENAVSLAEANVVFGKFCGEKVKEFMDENSFDAEFISSHGHTVFHQPVKGYTCQIGSGEAISAVCRLPVVHDFRTADVVLGGQGAPLVPIGDKLLFGAYESCLNLGGIANISFDEGGKRVAFDVCVCNMVLNHLSKKKNLTFDKGGMLAQAGNLIPELLVYLNNLSYYKLSAPKSLGREDVEREVMPLFDETGMKTEDLLRTICEHIAIQIGNVAPSGKMLVTGGGAHNDFLIERIRENSDSEVIVPDQLSVDFKEALVFAFLGLLRWRNENNCLASVTGCKYDHCAGSISMP